MAIGIKTLEYVFQSNNSSLAAATRYDFTAITLYIPETTSRTFRSVRVTVFARGFETAAASLTSPIIGIKLGATAFDNLTLGNPPANTGESNSAMFERDVTSYFTTNFGAGASQTCQVGVQFSGIATINISVKVYITYEYDNGASTVAKTVRIPLDSGTGALTTTLTQIGTNQIPALDSFLPETSKVYRNIWLEFVYNDSTLGTTNDSQLGMQVDSGTEHLSGAHESVMASSCFCQYFWDQGASPVWSTASAHALNLRSSNVTTASTFNHVGVILCVTYEYAASSSTVINSLMLGMGPIQSGRGASGDETGSIIEFLVNEPATVTLAQSGVLMLFGQSTSNGPVVKTGSGTARTYTDVSLAYCGASALTQRFDSGGAGGASLSLARGLNQLPITVRSGTSGIAPFGYYGVVYLNYTSAVASGGESTHNHTTIWNVQNSIAAAQVSQIAASQWIWIPESNWYLNDLSIACWGYIGTTAAPALPYVFSFEAGSGEILDGNYFEHFSAWHLADTELGVFPVILPLHGIQARQMWKRWSNDPETWRFSPTASRRILVVTGANTTMPLFFMMTHNGITGSATGTISGSGGGTVNVALLETTSRRLVATGSRTGNGSYTLLGFNTALNHFVEAREGASYLGRSDDTALA